MDLTIDIDDYRLNVRAAGIIEHNGKVLFHKNVNKDHYGLIGGRVEIGEDTATTVKREVGEEIGKEVEITKFISTIENFFITKDSKYHELFFVYKLEFIDEDDKKIEHTLYNIEGKDYLTYEWLDLSKIDEYTIVPNVIKKILKEPVIQSHIINNDIIK